MGMLFLQYAERLPIGLEKVIRTVTPETVKQFYQKWYHLGNMAVVAVGDFADSQVRSLRFTDFHNIFNFCYCSHYVFLITILIFC